MSHPDISEELPELSLREWLMINGQKRLEVERVFSVSLGSKMSSTWRQ